MLITLGIKQKKFLLISNLCFIFFRQKAPNLEEFVSKTDRERGENL